MTDEKKKVLHEKHGDTAAAAVVVAAWRCHGLLKRTNLGGIHDVCAAVCRQKAAVDGQPAPCGRLGLGIATADDDDGLIWSSSYSSGGTRLFCFVVACGELGLWGDWAPSHIPRIRYS